MIKATLELYVLIFDKEDMSYYLLSEHSEIFEPLSVNLSGKIDIKNLLSVLFIKYTNISSDFTQFICLDPYIKNMDEIIVPYYCLVPYKISPQECYILPSKNYVYNIPILRKILNAL